MYIYPESQLGKYLLKNNKSMTRFAKEIGYSQGHISSIISGSRLAGQDLYEAVYKATNGEVRLERSKPGQYNTGPDGTRKRTRKRQTNDNNKIYEMLYKKYKRMSEEYFLKSMGNSNGHSEEPHKYDPSSQREEVEMLK